MSCRSCCTRRPSCQSTVSFSFFLHWLLHCWLAADWKLFRWVFTSNLSNLLWTSFQPVTAWDFRLLTFRLSFHVIGEVVVVVVGTRTKSLLLQRKHGLSGAARHFLDHIRKRDKLNNPTLLNKHMCTLSILSEQAVSRSQCWAHDLARAFARLLLWFTQTDQRCSATLEMVSFVCLVWKFTLETLLDIWARPPTSSMLSLSSRDRGDPWIEFQALQLSRPRARPSLPQLRQRQRD